ncbi:MAG: TlpA disulfide reductase family protein [Flavobacteriaceae bacterium]|nr:TlpA disulfide reductase family protein [Flavobacteriaceae bacterium]
MKNLLIISLSLILVLISCQQEPKDYVRFSGEIHQLEPGIDSVLVFIPNGFERRIAIETDGKFSDTMKVQSGKYRFKIGDEYGTFYLENNDEIHLKTDYKDFDKKLQFSGKGLSVLKSQVETEKLHLMIDGLSAESAKLSQEEFKKRMEKLRTDYAELKSKHANLDASFWKDSDTEIDEAIGGFEEYINQKHMVAEKFIGKASPTFTYESIDGENVKLEDFKGKYVYLDIWATWCGPCKREIPALKQLEKEYEGKNIQIISISIDKLGDKDKWKKFVEDEQLTGVQLFADNDWNSDFVKAYEIRGIPRFILLDPNGIIIDPDASRPSDPDLKKQFNELGI